VFSSKTSLVSCTGGLTLLQFCSFFFSENLLFGVGRGGGGGVQPFFFKGEGERGVE
jgi:hypothetical protein